MHGLALNSAAPAFTFEDSVVRSPSLVIHNVAGVQKYRKTGKQFSYGSYCLQGFSRVPIYERDTRWAIEHQHGNYVVIFRAKSYPVRWLQYCKVDDHHTRKLTLAL